MTRVLLAAVVLAAFPPNSRADEAAVRLTVRPMPAPKPALKYQLLPELSGVEPRQCRPELPEVLHGAADVLLQQGGRRRTRPLPDDAARRAAGWTSCSEYGGSALRQADWAARLDTLDWQALERIQNGGMETLPAELGPLQVLAAALQVRFRAEVAGRHFDDAIRTAKTMFALARHLGEHPTEVAEPGRAVGRASRPRHAGRDGAAAGLPQPLLGADRSALSAGGSAQGRAGRPHPGRGGAAVAPRRRSHDGGRDRERS